MKVRTVKVTKDKVIVGTVNVSMSPAQATALVDVLGHVGGLDRTARGEIDSILCALVDAGYDVHDSEYHHRHLKGTVYFIEVPDDDDEEG